MAIFTGSGVALVTPFHEDESINYDKLDEMLDYHCTHGTDSIIICCLLYTSPSPRDS